MKKRTFLLLEILIALFLVSLCIVPMVSHPLQMLKDEFKKLELMEKERHADWAFSEVKEMLLKNEIPWEKIPKMGETTGPFPLSDAKLQLRVGRAKRLKRQFTLYGKGKKDGLQGEEFRQIYVHINFHEEKFYTYRLPIQKLPLDK